MPYLNSLHKNLAEEFPKHSTAVHFGSTNKPQKEKSEDQQARDQRLLLRK